MNIKELIFGLDVNELADAYTAILDESYDLVKHRRLFLKFLDTIRDIEPRASDNVILGAVQPDYDFGDYIDVTMYCNSELKESFTRCPEYDEIGDTEALSDDDIERLRNVSYERVIGYAFELDDWNEILGYAVDEDNVNMIGAAAFAAAVTFEMTFCGYEEECMIKKRDELIESAKEAEELHKLPPEEQARHFTSFEELMERIGYTDDRTPEEKVREEAAFRRKALIGSINAYRALRDYYGKYIG